MEAVVFIVGVAIIIGLCDLCDWMASSDYSGGSCGDGSFGGILFCGGDVFAVGVDIEVSIIGGDAVIVSGSGGIYRGTSAVCLEFVYRLCRD